MRFLRALHPEVPRMSLEDGISRIYGGIHFDFGNEQGLRAGKYVSDYIWRNFLKPLP